MSHLRELGLIIVQIFQEIGSTKFEVLIWHKMVEWSKKEKVRMETLCRVGMEVVTAIFLEDCWNKGDHSGAFT